MDIPETTANPAPMRRFPPFPKPPSGVKLVPFKDFVERGIRVNNHDTEVEVDGLGIPTVELQTKHGTDKCKTNAKRKYKNQSAGHAPDVKKKEWWWTSWAEGEGTRDSCTYSLNDTDVDRFYQAAADFRKTRTWPAQGIGIAALWDQFRLFAGLLSNTPVCRKADAGKPHAEPDNDEDDEGDDGYFSSDAEAEKIKVVVVNDAPSKGKSSQKSNPGVQNSKACIEVQDIEAIQALLDDAGTQKEQKLEQFLSDPENSMKRFLSSHMRDQGLIWSAHNLENVPRIVFFFINFIIRNRALPEHDRGLRRAAQVIELGMKELPLTSKIGQALPGDFCKACEALWGRRSSGFTALSDTEEAETEKKDQGEGEAKPEDRNAKRQKLSDPDKLERFEAEARAANIPVMSGNDIDPRKDVIEDNVGGDVKLNVDGDWGLGGWGTGASDSWGETNTDWMTPDVSGWEDPSPTLLAIMGPTALPITHEPGVVEWSMRRIKAVVPVPSTQQKVSKATDESDAEAVEQELEKRFAKMVLEPWLSWDPSNMQDISKPRILPKSRGAAIASEGVSKESSANSPTGIVHNAMTDDITVLVPASTVDILGVGMGLAATWVQMVRQESAKTRQTTDGGKKKKKKGKKSAETYWYMEQLMAILPSYHTS